MRKTKKLLSAILISCLSLILAAPVHAATVPDLTKKGSISVTILDTETKKPVNAGNLDVYQVAEIKEAEGKVSYVYTKEFSSCGYSLDNLESMELADNLNLYAQKQKIAAKTLPVNTSGKGIIADLSCGLYLVAQRPENVIKGNSILKPFLVSIPLNNGKEWVYKVDASPKAGGISPDPTKPTPTPTSKPSVTPTLPPGVVPQTGQLWWPVPMLAMAGLLMIIIGWVKRRE